MTTEEERRDMQHYPLPVDANIYSECPTNLVLANIAFLQESIEHEEAHISYLKSEMEKLKSRAIAENLKDQGRFFLIETVGKKMRNPIDIVEFSRKFPDIYMKIRDRQYLDLADKHEKERQNLTCSPIPLGLADKVMGSDAVTELVGFKPQTVTVTVGIRQNYGRLK